MSNRILLHVQGRILLDDLSIELAVPEDEILKDMKRILERSSSTFGLRPFRIEFDGQRGWSILPSSCVGVISGDVLTIVLDSRLPDLRTEKVIAMAQLAGPDVYRISSDSVRATSSSSWDFGSRDLLAMSLVDVCAEVRRSGREFVYRSVHAKTLNIRGSIDFAESLQTASTKPPISVFDERSYATDANIYILSALEKAMRLTRSEVVHEALRQETEVWSDDIDSEATNRFDTEISDFSTSYPRSDYRRGIHLASAVLFDLSIDFHESNLEIPQVLADLDVLFEQYCTLQLRQLLPASTFVVDSQQELPHPAYPQLSGYIKPDLVITHRDSGRSIVIDLKNKYSRVDIDEKPSLSNPDIYQISYYAQALGIDKAMLIYPTTTGVEAFPIKRSESTAAYLTKIQRFRERRQSSEPILRLGANEVALLPYQVDLSGSMANTAESLASLAMFIDYLLSQDQE